MENEMFVEYKGAVRIKGNLLFFETVEGVGYGEKVLVRHGEKELFGRVAAVDEKVTLIEVLGNSYDLGVEELRVKFSGEPFMTGVDESMLGRAFNAFSEPIDGMGPVVSEKRMDITGSAYNPAWRVHPRSFVHTGISAIDGLNTLVQGQKLPIFALSGLATDELVAQIVRQIGSAGEKSAVVFAAIGIKHENADFFIRNILGSGQQKNTAVFINRLLRRPPGDLRQARRDPEPKRVSRLHVQRPGDDLRACRDPERKGGVFDPDTGADDARRSFWRRIAVKTGR